MVGSRLLFWLQPFSSAFSVMGYESGTVLAFSTKTPSTRRCREFSGCQRGGSGFEDVAAGSLLMGKMHPWDWYSATTFVTANNSTAIYDATECRTSGP